MPFSSMERRRVYLGCRPIFTGVNAQLRKQKKIRELVEKHRSSLATLFTDFGIDGIVEILKELLERRVFVSELQAKTHFPELFSPSPSREIQHAASEQDVARSTTQLLAQIEPVEAAEVARDFEVTEGDIEDHGNEEEIIDRPTTSLPDLGQGPSVEQKSPPPLRQPPIPTLFPSRLAYSVQHLILNAVQKVLEDCCFDFARMWLPEILDKHGWDCAVAAELTHWVRLLDKKKLQIPSAAFSEDVSSIHSTLVATQQLRHIAVHRLPITARQVRDLVERGVKLAEILRDHRRAARLDDLRQEIEDKINAMELHKNALEDKLRSQLNDICDRRAELDRQEVSAVQAMLAEDDDNRTLIMILLKESTNKVFEDDCHPLESSRQVEDVSDGDSEAEAKTYQDACYGSQAPNHT